MSNESLDEIRIYDEHRAVNKGWNVLYCNHFRSAICDRWKAVRHLSKGLWLFARLEIKSRKLTSGLGWQIQFTVRRHDKLFSAAFTQHSDYHHHLNAENPHWRTFSPVTNASSIIVSQHDRIEFENFQFFQTLEFSKDWLTERNGEGCTQHDNEATSSVVSWNSPPMSGEDEKMLTIGQGMRGSRTFAHVWKKENALFPSFALADRTKAEMKGESAITNDHLPPIRVSIFFLPLTSSHRVCVCASICRQNPNLQRDT